MRQRIFLSPILFIFFIQCFDCLSIKSKHFDETIIKIDSGFVKGHYIRNEKVIEWNGIPYASPPIKEKRFRSPSAVDPWNDMLIANKIPPACPQQCTLAKIACPLKSDENCLYLTVTAPSRKFPIQRSKPYQNSHSSSTIINDNNNNKQNNQDNHAASNHTSQKPIKIHSTPLALRQYDDSFLPINLFEEEAKPKPTELLPVFVFIHGGVFLFSDSSVPIHNLSAIAETGVVTVAFNYRLGALGFLSTKGVNGNFGFEDQIFALEWVKKNIAAFGGDPNRVTLGGHSAGGISVLLHLASKASAGLFSQAILQSPFPGVPLFTQEQAKDKLGYDFVTAIGCDENTPNFMECLQNASISSILDAQALHVYDLKFIHKLYGTPYFSTFSIPWSPVINELIPDQPLNLIRKGEWNKVPLISGFTHDEFASFIPILIPELDSFKYKSLLYLVFGITNAGSILENYPAAESEPDKRKVLGNILRDMLIACPMKSLAFGNNHNSYFYRYDHIFNDSKVWGDYETYCANNACHSSELAAVFGLDASITDGTETVEEAKEREKVVNYWAQFIKTGNPKFQGSLPWTPFMEKPGYLVIDTPSKIEFDQGKADMCALWEKIGYFW